MLQLVHDSDYVVPMLNEMLALALAANSWPVVGRLMMVDVHSTPRHRAGLVAVSTFPNDLVNGRNH